SGRGGYQSVPLNSPAFLPRPESWTEWQPIPGSVDEEIIAVLREDTLWGLAYSLSGLFLLSWWWARHHWKPLGFAVMLFWLAASVLGFLWLPVGLQRVFWLPMLGGIVLAVGWYLVTAIRSRIDAQGSERTAAAAVVLLLSFAVGLPGHAAPGPF